MSMLTKSRWKSLLKQAKEGDSDSQFEAGYYYEEGFTNQKGERIVKPDLTQAKMYYTFSANQGNIDAQNALGVVLSSENSNKQDIKEAVKWLRIAIKNGSSTSAHNLACIFRDKGKLRKSFKWYKKAARMGDADSYLYLALCYYLGVGTRQRTKKAIAAFKNIISSKPELTCQRSKENSMCWLAIISLKEDFSNKDRILESRILLEKANADDDHELANDLLNLIGKSKLHIA